MLNISTNNYVTKQTCLQQAGNSTCQNKETPCTPIKQYSKNFGSSPNVTKDVIAAPVTRLRNKEELQKYSTVAQNLDAKDKKLLDTLLKTGVLLSNNSNDKSTLLDNLENICTQPRIYGLDDRKILKETITAISNPYTITQKFGNIPDNLVNTVIEHENAKIVEQAEKNQAEGKPITTGLINKNSLNINSSSCVAASIEFNLAKNQPAEFARMISEVSSPKYAITKNIKLDTISQNHVEAMWLLKEFGVNYKAKNKDEIEVTIAPDQNAIVRARIQTVDKDPLERSAIDVLLQSTFMNIGSQNTYNSLIDTRTGKYNPDNKGLTDIEKNLTEVLATGKNKVSVTYQILDDDGKITGYECELKTIRQQITDALKMGETVIIGYTYPDKNNVVMGGHEITIVGLQKDKNGKEFFVCNDTDDEKSEPVFYEVDELLPKIHHAGLPKEALKEDVEFVQSWKENLKEYKKFKKAV